MSGICGAFGKGDIEQMTRTLSHRGPDDMGFYMEGPVQLGAHRLAIIDLPGGHQPMSNEDQTLWALLDGELFNYEELRVELVKLGHRFVSRTDTEVLIHAWEEWGPAALDRFNGQFAVALWDGKNLHLARDRIGEKPLYYYQRGGRLLFASEIKSLLTEISAVPRFTDAFRDFETPLFGDTMFANVRELLPGHRLSFNGQELKLEAWWELPSFDGPYPSDRELVEELRALLEDAVKLRLRGEVAMGLLLSGGLDSAALAGLAAPEQVFTITFRELGEPYDELAHARLMADRIRAKLHVIRPRAADLKRMFPSMLWHLDQPVASLSSLAMFMTAREAARRGIKSLLVGQGADELFGGHTRYLMMLAEDRIGQEPALRHYLPLARYFWGPEMFGDPADRYYRIISRGPGRDRGLVEKIKKMFDSRQHLIDKMGWVDLQTALPTVLHMDDRATAAFGMENRNPFLDHRLVEFAFRLPPHLKVDGFLGKVILRRALRGVVPDPILDREDKMGLAVPVGAWFRKELKRWVEVRKRRLSERYAANFLNAAWDAAGDRGEFDRKDYMRVCLELWFEIMIDKEQDGEKLRLSAREELE